MTDNELIAEFMGVQVYQTNDEMRAVPLSDLKLWALPFQLQYDKKWNELMPVVEKIESLYDGTSIRIRIVGDRAVCYDTQNAQQANIYSGEGVGIISSARNMPSKIEAVYKAVVEFIKWHNQQK